MKHIFLLTLLLLSLAAYGQKISVDQVGWLTGVGAPSATCSAVINNGAFYTDSGSSILYQCYPVLSVYGWHAFSGSGGGFTAGGDLSGSSTSQTVIGLNGVPFCAGYTPLNGELVEYTTGGSPNPCYTAAILQLQFSTNYISVPSSANQVIGLVPNALGATVTVPASCTGSVAKAYASATASTVFTVVDLNTSTTLCTLTWAISGTVPTITGAGGTVSVGDIVEFIGPATADLTLGNITIGIHGTH